jgi:hypothetical protein
LVGALIGAAIGWGASLQAANKANAFSRAREEAEEKALRDAVRTMLSTEIDQNLEILHSEEEDVFKYQPNDLNRVEWVAMNPIPHWSTAVWEASILDLATALTAQERKAVQRLYVLFHSLSAARTALQNVVVSDRYTFQRAEPPYDRAKEFQQEIFSVGNPLQ